MFDYHSCVSNSASVLFEFIVSASAVNLIARIFSSMLTMIFLVFIISYLCAISVDGFPQKTSEIAAGTKLTEQAYYNNGVNFSHEKVKQIY